MIEPSPTEGMHGKEIDNKPLNSSQQEGALEECVQSDSHYEQSEEGKKTNIHNNNDVEW